MRAVKVWWAIGIARRTITSLMMVSALVLTVGCGKEKNTDTQFDAGPPGNGSDGGVGATAAPPAAETVSAGGKLRGGNVEMDVQVGHPTSQKKTTGGNTTVEGNSAIKR